MAQIVREPGLGELLGTGLGTGLSQGLQSLANFKMKQLEQQAQLQQQEAQRAQLGEQYKTLGLDPGVAYLPPAVQNQYVKEHLQKPQNLAFAQGLQALLGGAPAAQPGVDPASAMQPGVDPNVATGEQPPIQDQTTREPGIADVPAETGEAPRVGQQLPDMSQLRPGQALKLADLGLKKDATERKLSLAQKKLDADKERFDKRMAFETEKFQKEQDVKKAKLKEIEQEKLDKETLPLVDEINKKYKASLASDERLNRIQQLQDKGELGLQPLNVLFKTVTKGIAGVGIDLTSLMTADAQELDKLSTDFAKDASQYSGPRLTDTYLKTFMQTVPSLMQSKEGRQRVINNLRDMNEIIQIRKETMDEIIKENEGRRPRNLEMLIEERMEPKVQEMHERDLKVRKLREKRKKIQEADKWPEPLDTTVGALKTILSF